MRSTIFVSTAVVYCSFFAGLISATDKSSSPPKDAAIEIDIRANEVEVDGEKEQVAEIIVQGKSLSVPFEIEELTKLIGEANRVSKQRQDRDGKTYPLKNWIMTWDELGIIAYCKPGSTKVFQVAACLTKETAVFSPKQRFSGKVTLDGAEITSDSTLDRINQAKKGTKLVGILSGLLWCIDCEDAMITVRPHTVNGKKTGKVAEVGITSKGTK